MQILTVSGLQKTYTTRFGGSKVQALKNVSFSVESGEYIAIMGESGSGKTTLLNILAALDKPTAGTVLLDGRNFTKIRESEAATFRRDHLGFVFQEFNLLDTFTLEDNIYLPLVLAGKSYDEMRTRLIDIAETLGIRELLKKYPYEVSGGQKQRAAVARALITKPRRRADRRARQQIHGRAAPSLRRGEPHRADDPHGHALREGRELRRARPLHPRRRGVPPALPRRRHERALLPAHLRNAHDARGRR